MTEHWKYLSYVVRHKWFVLVAGLRVKGIPLWRLLIHDWSKFSLAEWGPYARYFYQSRSHMAYAEDPLQKPFDEAWLHHQHHNPHHWQHWILREDSGDTKVLRMPTHFAREMVADWMGAGRAITGRWEVKEWYSKNSEKIKLHPVTYLLVAEIIGGANG